MIKDICDKLASLQETTWAKYAYRREIFRGKITFPEYYSYYLKAVSEGRQHAQKYVGRKPEEIAEELGLKIQMISQNPGESTYEFAMFVEPNQVKIYETNAAESQEILNSLDEKKFNQINVVDTLIAHEDFHALQTRNSDLFVNQKHVLLWKILRIENRARLTSLEEVAAMSFSKELLQMDVNPYMLDVVMCMSRAPARAKEIYQVLCDLEAED